jgi:endonuclease/exonuclease/phosphatase family metal-dependent hydrolase
MHKLFDILLLTRIAFVIVIVPAILLTSCSEDNAPPQPPPEPVLEVSNCLAESSSTKLEILTWNLKEFPLIGANTVAEFAKMVSDLDADLIALQEISSRSWFNRLLEALPGWGGEISISGNLNLAYLYKLDEVDLISSIYAIYEDDPYAFPRPPALIEIVYSNEEITLINIHLKCCGGEENFDRRQEASEKLKSYIDTNLNEDAVILLGDYNDLITGVIPEEIPFANFINDSLNYSFVDMEIAEADESVWSYPNWPSHIDHILVTNELFEAEVLTQTLTLDLCDTRYLNIVSDHRPVMVTLEF